MTFPQQKKKVFDGDVDGCPWLWLCIVYENQAGLKMLLFPFCCNPEHVMCWNGTLYVWKEIRAMMHVIRLWKKKMLRSFQQHTVGSFELRLEMFDENLLSVFIKSG